MIAFHFCQALHFLKKIHCPTQLGLQEKTCQMWHTAHEHISLTHLLSAPCPPLYDCPSFPGRKFYIMNMHEHVLPHIKCQQFRQNRNRDWPSHRLGLRSSQIIFYFNNWLSQSFSQNRKEAAVTTSVILTNQTWESAVGNKGISVKALMFMVVIVYLVRYYSYSVSCWSPTSNAGKPEWSFMYEVWLKTQQHAIVTGE